MGEEVVESTQIINPEEIVNELDVNAALDLCQSIGMTFDDIKDLQAKNKQYSALEKELKPLKAKIRTAMLKLKAKNAMFGDIKLTLTIQNKDTMDEDKLVEVLLEKGLEDALITIQKPDPNKLPMLIANGQLTDEDIQSCMIPNKVPVLSFPRAKKASTTATTESFSDNVSKHAKKAKMF